MNNNKKNCVWTKVQLNACRIKNSYATLLENTNIMLKKSSLKHIITRYSIYSFRFPRGMAFATCFAKGALADITSQNYLDHHNEDASNSNTQIDIKRVGAFALFSGAYLGVGQHYVYNVAFRKMFGEKATQSVWVQKVIADSFVHVPMIYLPLYFIFENTMLQPLITPDINSVITWLKTGTSKGIEHYQMEAWNTLTTYWKMWPVFHYFNFRFTPKELRIGSIASFSYLWLVALSFISHSSLKY